MSGGSFLYAYRQVNEFAEMLDAKLRRADEPALDADAAGDGSTLAEVSGLPEDIRARLAAAIPFLAGVAACMRDIEWYFSGDYGDDSLRESMAEWPPFDAAVPTVAGEQTPHSEAGG